MCPFKLFIANGNHCNLYSFFFQCSNRHAPVFWCASLAPFPSNEAGVNVEVELLAQVRHVSGQGVQVHHHGIPASRHDNTRSFLASPLSTEVAVSCKRSPVGVVCQFWHPLRLPGWGHLFNLGEISFSLSWSSPWRQLLRVQECEARGAKINWQLSFTATKEGKKEITRKLQNSEKLGARLCPGFSLYLVVAIFSYLVSLSSLCLVRFLTCEGWFAGWFQKGENSNVDVPRSGQTWFGS